MIGAFLCKVSLAHLAFLRCGNICTKVLGNWSPGSSPARGTGAGQVSLSTADTSYLSSLSEHCRYQQEDEKGVSLGEFWQQGKESPTKACLSAFLKQNMGSHLSK